jgi:hypothetical protein
MNLVKSIKNFVQTGKILDWFFEPSPNKFEGRFMIQINFSLLHFFSYGLFLLFMYVILSVYTYRAGYFITSTDIYYHFDNYFHMLIFLIFPYFIAGHYASFTWFTALSCFCITFIFEYVGNFSSLNTALIPINNWSTAFSIAISIIFVLIIIVIIWHFYFAQQNNILLTYFIITMFPLVYLIAAVIMYLLRTLITKDPTITFHIHHWIIGYILMFFCAHPNNLSRFFSGFCLAIFINGIALYGVGSIFAD